jgi:flagellar hook-associated protein 1 FlgK
MAVQLTNSDRIAAASQSNLTTAAAAANTGGATIGAAQVSNPAQLSLTGSVSLTYNAGQYSVTGAVPAVANIAFAGPGAQAISFNGISFSITGTPNNGDVFTVGSAGSGDNGNAVAMAALQTTGILDNGTTTFSGSYAQMVSNVASLASESDLNTKAFTSLVTQATDAQQSLSGVNLDEEAANLIRFQQAYQAAAKAMSVANTLFSSILAIGQ